MIEVEDLRKRYPRSAEEALRGVSFRIEPGTLAAIVGTSGSGKTTLLRCLVGLEPFDGGRVRVDGVEAAGRSASQLRQKVGLVFQSFELFPHLTVMENCAMAPVRVRREPRPEVEARVRLLLASLGLDGRETAFPAQLSGGQRQRVAMARALAMEPSLLLYDEPTSALDASLKREVLQTLQRVRQSGVTQLLVTHDLSVARAVADTVLVMHQGQLVEQGPAAAVLANPSHLITRTLLSDAGHA